MKFFFKYPAIFLLSVLCGTAGAKEGRFFSAQADTAYTLESVSVTGSRVPLSLGQSARIVTVLDSVAISSMPAQTVNDILKYSIGVDVRQRGDMGMQTDISMRGGTFDQIAILLDGINICDPQTGHNAADFPVDIVDIERIEILEGPAARTYGTSSLVGAINIVTRKPSSSGGAGHLEGGSYGYMNSGLSMHEKSGHYSGSLSTSYSRSDGYSRNSNGGPNSDFKVSKVFGKGTYDDGNIMVQASAGMSVKDFGSNTFYSAKFDDQFEHTLKTYAAVQARTTGRISFRPSVYWNHGNDRFELFRGAPEKYPYNYHRTNVFGMNLGAELESFLGKTAFGTEIRNEDIVSTNLGDSLNTRKGDHYAVGLNRTNISFYLEHNVIMRNFTVSGGLMAAENTGSEDGFGLYPGLDASLRFAGNWKLYASYNSSLRMPTFTELYYSVGGHRADKYLKPEKMQAVEGGLKFMKPGLNVVASLYYHHGTDMIDWIKDLRDGEDAQWTSVNHSVVNTLGEEITVRIDLPVLLGRDDAFIRNVDLGYSHIDQDKETEAHIESLYALEYLRNKFVAQAGFHIWDRLYLNLSCRWMDRVGSYDRYFAGKPTGEKVEFEPYTLVDAKFSWETKKIRLYLEANNLLDKTYYDHGNIPQPGIWVRGGVVWNFTF